MRTVRCVLYHHVGAETAFEAGLNVASSRERFTAQIDKIAKDYDIVDLTTLLSGRLPPRPLLITFDDCYASVLDVAREVLAARGLPSVFFINPGLLGPEALSLDSMLAWCANTVGLDRLCTEIGVPTPTSLGELIACESSKLCASARAALKERLRKAFGPEDLVGRAPILRPEDLAVLPAFGVEVGNHTATHVHCRALDPSELEAEITAAKARLEALSGTSVRAFSVPYGHEQDLSPVTLALLRNTGHEAIFLVHARSNRFRPAPDIWYRVSLHNEHPRALGLKLDLLPMLRSLWQKLPQ